LPATSIVFGAGGGVAEAVCARIKKGAQKKHTTSITITLKDVLVYRMWETSNL
jgi:hypothetical protein